MLFTFFRATVWTWTPAILWATRWRSTETTSTGTNPSSRPSTGSSSTQTLWPDTVRVIYTGLLVFLGALWDTVQCGTIHRLNMELDLQGLFGLHVHSCTHWLAETPHTPQEISQVIKFILGAQPMPMYFDYFLWYELSKKSYETLPAVLLQYT